MEAAVASGSGRASTAGVMLLDDLRIDLGRRQVWRDQVEIPLPKLSFELLAALIEAAPNLISTDALMDRVWGRVVVSPETVSQRVKLLRDALGDDAKNPRYVAIVRGQGYRLARDVRPVDSAAVGTRAEPEAATAPHRRFAAALAVLATVVIAALTYVALRQPGPTELRPSDAIAILPFDDLGMPRGNEHFGEAVADAVLHRVAGTPGVTVIARSSAFAYAGRKRDAREIGAELGARYLITGSLQGDGNTLRITTQLTDTRTGTELWSIQLDRTTGDVLGIQDEIAERIARSFVDTLGRPAAESLPAPGTRNVAAQLAFLQGRRHAQSARIADLRQAIALFEQAVRLDRQFGAAHSAAADALVSLSQAGDDQSRSANSPALDAAARHIQLALAADPDDGEALIARARIEGLRGDTAAAERDFRRGLQLRPNLATGYRDYARFLFYGLDPLERARDAGALTERQGRYSLALELADRARRLDPLSPANQFIRGQMALHLGRNDEAEGFLRRALQVDATYHPALIRLGQLNWLRGSLADAVLYAERAIALDPEATWMRRLAAHFYVDAGDPARARSLLAEGGRSVSDGLLAVLLYERKIQEAGELALAQTDRQPRTWDRDISAFALRELARIDPERQTLVLERLRSRLGYKDVAGRQVIHHSSRFAALEIADLMIASGEANDGRRLAAEVIASVDQDTAAMASPDVTMPLRTDQRQMATAHALLGEDSKAMDALERLVSEKSTRHLWYEIERQPALNRVRGNPRFQSLATQYQQHLSDERAKLDELRAQGAIPQR